MIEIDGGQHNESEQILYDQLRTEWFASQGYQVIRFWNYEVMGQLEGVLEVIWDICNGKLRGEKQDSPINIPSPHAVWGKVKMGGLNWQDTLNPHLAPRLTAWLSHKGSFMERLKIHGILDAKIKVLAQSWQMPWESECELLQTQEFALVREVSIKSGEKCWMYARTIFTKAILEGELACLAHLENRPLGTILFKDPLLTRGEFEYLSVYNAYARRSLFKKQEKSLLLTEVFMPDMVTI